MQDKKGDDEFCVTIKQELLDVPPYIEKTLHQRSLTLLAIFQSIRKRVNFFAIYNLFDWSENVDLDLQYLKQQNEQLKKQVKLM